MTNVILGGKALRRCFTQASWNKLRGKKYNKLKY